LVGGETVFGFPEGDAGDGKALGPAGAKNFPGDVFGGGVIGEKVDGFAFNL
jgi:hypothetical protein